MWASSCATIASNSAAFRPVSSPAGSKMAGFSHPRTKGTEALVQPKSPTGLPIPSRACDASRQATSTGSSIGWRPRLARRIDRHSNSNRVASRLTPIAHSITRLGNRGRSAARHRLAASSSAFASRRPPPPREMTDARRTGAGSALTAATSASCSRAISARLSDLLLNLDA